MLEILVIGIAMLVMARRPKPKRRMGKYIRGTVDEELTIAGLATRSLTLVAFDEAVEERSFISSIVASWSMDEWTPTANAGPIMVGVAHSDYTAAEIEEWIENTASWSEGDLVQSREIGKRLIRKVGIFRDRGVVLENIVLGNGRPIKTKLGWILTTGQTLDLWAYNLGGASVATTTPSIHCEGHANLWPR